MNARDVEKLIIMAKYEASGMKEWDVLTVWIKKKTKNICTENVTEEQDLAPPQHFP